MNTNEVLAIIGRAYAEAERNLATAEAAANVNFGTFYHEAALVHNGRHEALFDLIRELDPDSQRIAIESYKLTLGI